MRSVASFAAALTLAFPAAPTDWAVLDPPAAGPTFGVQQWSCADGQSRLFLSSLAHAEMRTGILASEPFAAPEALSFWYAGHSHQQANELRLVDAASGELLRREPPPGNTTAQQQEWDLSAYEGRQVRLELVDGDTGTGFAWLALGGLEPELAPMPEESGALPQAWDERRMPADSGTTDGIPWKHRASYVEEGAALEWALPNVRAERAYIFTAENSHAQPNPAWGGGDPFENIFIGDSAGELVLTYASGLEDVIPLVFGYTMWWRGPYEFAHAPFSTDAEAVALLDDALCVANGAKAYEAPDKPFYLSVALRDEPLTQITLRDNADKIGHPELKGVTFSGEVAWEGEGLTAAEGAAPPEAMAEWLAEHTLHGDEAYPPAHREAVGALGRRLYTYANDITAARVAATEPGYDLSAWSGPRITFHGPPEAEILTHTYYDSALELLDRIEPDGMLHESAKGAANYNQGFGTWHPSLGAFYGKAYTRNRSMALLSLLGFQDKAEDVIGFFNKWIMYFPESYPELQLGGEPVPGHSTVIANQPHIYFDELRKVGWPTRYETRDFGNPENDGHGFLMLGHWRAWTKAGRDPQWVRTRWTPIKEAADYILWALDNPELSFSERGLLYSESEGGMTAVTLYCNVPCYYGLLAYAEMAESVGEDEAATRWRETAEAMRAAIDAYMPGEDGAWDTTKAGDWGYEQGVLAPLLFGAEYHGWNAANRIGLDWAKRTRRSYEQILGMMQPDYCAPAGFGYGQGYFTEAALLLDRMGEADKMLRWMARLCFAPEHPHPYRVPEGSTVGEGGAVWRRWGDLGNLYQMNEAAYTVQVMAGVDDTDPKQLNLLPRVPATWEGMDVEGYPVRTRSERASKIVYLDLKLRHLPEEQAMEVTVTPDRPVTILVLRLGPLPHDARDIRVTRDGEEVVKALDDSGDAKWAGVVAYNLDSATTWRAEYR